MKKNDYWAVILCGGFGSRMGSITKEIPKPLIPIHNQPILWYILMTLSKYKINNLIFPLGYKGALLQEYVETNFGKSEFCLHFTDTGIDTSIALRMSKISEIIPENTDFLLLNSDTIFDFDLMAMLNLHRNSNSLITLSSVEIVSVWGLVHKEKDGSVVGFSRDRKAHYLSSNGNHDDRGYIYSGISFINKNALKYIDLKKNTNFEQDLFSTIIEMKRVANYDIEGSWFAIDTEKDINMINQLTDDHNSRGQMVHKIKQKLSVLN